MREILFYDTNWKHRKTKLGISHQKQLIKKYVESSETENN